MDSSKFRLSKSPLAAVIGQVGFTYAPEFQMAGDLLRDPFRDLGLPIVEMHRNVHVEHGSPNTPPNVQHHEIWLFTNPSRTQGVSVGPRHFAFMVNDYTDFPQYAAWIGGLIDALPPKLASTYFCSIGLRLHFRRTDISFGLILPRKRPSGKLEVLTPLQ